MRSQESGCSMRKTAETEAQRNHVKSISGSSSLKMIWSQVQFGISWMPKLKEEKKRPDKDEERMKKRYGIIFQIANKQNEKCSAELYYAN